MSDKTLHLTILLRFDQNDDPLISPDDEARDVLSDLVSLVEERLTYWGYGPETGSPFTLIGDIR